MSEQLKTEVSDFDHPGQGYIVIAPLSAQSRDRIGEIQARYAKRFGASNLWLPHGSQLHITFAHIITPNAEYQEAPSVLFERLRPLAARALQLSAQTLTPHGISSTFGSIEAYSASVIIKARDDGSFDEARKVFTDNFELPVESRRPPNIIHSTICRFRSELDLAEVEGYINEIMADFSPFDEVTESLQLIHEQKIFVQQHQVLETFPEAV